MGCFQSKKFSSENSIFKIGYLSQEAIFLFATESNLSIPRANDARWCINKRTVELGAIKSRLSPAPAARITQEEWRKIFPSWYRRQSQLSLSVRCSSVKFETAPAFRHVREKLPNPTTRGSKASSILTLFLLNFYTPVRIQMTKTMVEFPPKNLMLELLLL